MSAKRLDGRALSTHVFDTLHASLQQRLQANKSLPRLAVIQIGDDAASTAYIQHKQRACERIGFLSHRYQLPKDTSQSALEKQINSLNHDPDTHGILLQLPLPEHLNSDALLECIHPVKDVDGFHPYNLGRLAQKNPQLRPCTPYGIMQLLAHYDINLQGKHAVIVGASNIVGRPMALELLMTECTTTICHRFTDDLAAHVNTADILIAAIGKPGVIKSNWLKEGSVVIDVGFTYTKSGLQGDIDFNSACERASWISPVPGGVGPMTVAALMQNTYQAASLQDLNK